MNNKVLDLGFGPKDNGLWERLGLGDGLEQLQE